MALGCGRSKSPRTDWLSTAAARPALQNHSAELGEKEKGNGPNLGCSFPIKGLTLGDSKWATGQDFRGQKEAWEGPQRQAQQLVSPSRLW